MRESVPKKLERGIRRGLAVVLGLVFGLVLGFVAGLLLFGFGDALLVTTGGVALLSAVACFVWPSPILFVAEVVLGMLGFDL